MDYSLFYSESGFALVESVFGMSNLSKKNLPSLLLFALFYIFPLCEIRGLFVLNGNEQIVVHFYFFDNRRDFLKFEIIHNFGTKLDIKMYNYFGREQQTVFVVIGSLLE